MHGLVAVDFGGEHWASAQQEEYIASVERYDSQFRDRTLSIRANPAFISRRSRNSPSSHRAGIELFAILAFIAKEGYHLRAYENTARKRRSQPTRHV